MVYIFHKKLSGTEWFSSDTVASLGSKDPITVLSPYRGSKWTNLYSITVHNYVWQNREDSKVLL